MGGSGDGISETLTDTAKDRKIFSLNGVYMGTDTNKLSKGIYIISGKKVVKE